MITSSEEIMGNYDPLDLLIRFGTLAECSLCIYVFGLHFY